MSAALPRPSSSHRRMGRPAAASSTFSRPAPHRGAAALRGWRPWLRRVRRSAPESRVRLTFAMAGPKVAFAKIGLTLFQSPVQLGAHRTSTTSGTERLPRRSCVRAIDLDARELALGTSSTSSSWTCSTNASQPGLGDPGRRRSLRASPGRRPCPASGA